MLFRAEARRQSLIFALLWIMLAHLVGCAATPHTKTLRDSPPQGLPASVELTATPFFPQRQYQCGPAALATVLGAQGVSVEAEALVPQVYLPAREGSLQIEMAASPRRYGMLSYLLAQNLQDLLTELAAGHPVLVMQNLGLDWLPQWHYAVVIGYDLVQEQLVLRSGTTERLVMSFALFERTWQRAEHWAMVVVSAGQVPVTAQPEQFLAAAHGLEQVGQWAAAAKAYRAATRRWPQHFDAWLMRGNLAYLQQEYAAAVMALREATILQPQRVAAWNNFAYALHASGCGDAAHIALQCGLQLAPQDANLLDSRHELSAQPMRQASIACPALACP